MSTARDLATPDRPLNRREVRENERLAAVRQQPIAAPAAAPTGRAAARAAARLATAAPLTPAARLTPAAQELVAAQLSEPDQESVVIDESDRVVAALPAESVDAESVRLLTEVSTNTTSTPVPLQSRASLRAAENARRNGTPARPPVATARLADPEVPFAPTRAFVPTPSATFTHSGAPTSARVRKLAAKGVSIAAMAFVALMAVATSIPADAMLSSADVQAAAFASARPANAEPSQSLNLAGGDTITVERDGYESSSIADIAAASGIRMEATFTNNPNGSIQWPFSVGVHIGDQLGPRNCAGCSSNHGGQDFNPGLGAPIQAVADGVVRLAQDGEGSLGVHMIIDHMVDGELVSSVYAHMIHDSMLFKTGDVVKVGQIIGKTGDTGMSTGPHLHFEIRQGGIDGTKIDPLKWLYEHTN